MNNEVRDEMDLVGFARAMSKRGVQLVTTSEQSSLVAAAVLGRALKRAGVALTGLTVASSGTSLDEEEARAAMRDAPSLLVVGTGLDAQLLAGDVPQLSIEAADGEPISATALRLAGALAYSGDASWVAALGLVRDPRPHPIVTQALTRHTRENLVCVADLLEAAGRSPMPGMMSVIALELLIATADPRRFLAAEPSELLRKCQAIVAAELLKATHVRPRAGHAVVVVEYESACRIEDLVAARWRGLRPGTAVLVANHGWVEGRVAVVARGATPEALAGLPRPLGDGKQALLTLATWAELLMRLGVPPGTIAAAEKHTLDFEAALSSSDATLVN